MARLKDAIPPTVDDVDVDPAYVLFAGLAAASAELSELLVTTATRALLDDGQAAALCQALARVDQVIAEHTVDDGDVVQEED